MGNVATHRLVADEVMKVLRKFRPSDEAMYFALGNSLTDLSQVRDPPAHAGGKLVIYGAGLEDWYSTHFLLKSMVGLDQYLEELMGKNGSHGALAQVLTKAVYAKDLEKFRKSSPPIPGGKFDQIFYANEIYYKGFTQYWPHEHLDFPPWPYKNVVGYRNHSKSAVHNCRRLKKGQKSEGGKRRLPEYLELQIEFAAELLTVVEYEWSKRAVEKKDASILLALLGHVSHTIEDFFFHSNFLEIAWQKLEGGKLPGNDDTTRNKRIYFRRLRSPKAGDAQCTRLSTAESEPCHLVITGSFGSEDVYHTILDLLEGIAKEKGGEQIPAPFGPLLDYFLDPAKRKRLHDPEGEPREKFLTDLRRNIENPEPAILALNAKYHLHSKSRRAIRDLCKIDQELYEEYTLVPVYVRGPIAFLFEMLCRADIAHDASEQQSCKFDRGGYVKYSASYDGASAENVGSHSLIAKDSPNKRPLYPQSLNLAKRVATYVAEVMVRQINRRQVAAARFEKQAKGRSGRAKPVTTLAKVPYVDWLHLLQHFLCHPDECESNWHRFAIKDPASATHHVVQFADPDVVAQRLKLIRRNHLETWYKGHGEEVERDWLRVADKTRN